MKDTQLSSWLEGLKTTGKPNMDEAIQYLGDIFPLLKEFKDTIQDPVWHAEGDVYIHTDMVLDELYKIFDNKEFVPSPTERRILILAAILHDIAKPITTYTCEDTGRVKASGHEVKGRDYLMFRLLELKLSTVEYLEVINLVGLHQRPKLLVIKNAPLSGYIELRSMVNYKLIYWLEIADLRGRTSDDIDEQIMYMDEFLKVSETCLGLNTVITDNSLLSTPASVSKYRDIVGSYLLRQGSVQSLEEAHLKLYEPSLKYGNAIIMCGVSGTGKSTHIKNKYEGYKVISMDDIRGELSNRRDQSNNGLVAQMAKERFKEALRAKENVVWDATNTRKEFREQLISLAHNYNALTTLDVLLDTESNIRRKNKDREFDVPESVITKQMKGFQFPSSNETHIVKYTIL